MPGSQAPRFLGQPSPSLQLMRRMSPGELREHLARLAEEAQRLDIRIQHLQRSGIGADAILLRQRLLERLAALQRAGAEMLQRRDPQRH